MYLNKNPSYHKCVTEAVDFQVVVLKKAVSETGLSALHDLKGDTLELKNSKSSNLIPKPFICVRNKG